jgi:predicted HAD superfamily Cof-like phosphohydrolase
MSDSQKVAEFTSGSGTFVPKVPELMNEEETLFVIKMMLDEIMELGATVLGSANVKDKMIKMIVDSKDINLPISEMSTNELIGEQADAFIDIYYYMQNASCKKGINLSKVFELVHEANMNKRFPDGTFHKREDGKVIKPPGWVSPDITGEIVRQCEEENDLKI